MRLAAVMLVAMLVIPTSALAEELSAAPGRAEMRSDTSASDKAAPEAKQVRQRDREQVPARKQDRIGSTANAGERGGHAKGETGPVDGTAGNEKSQLAGEGRATRGRMDDVANASRKTAHEESRADTQERKEVRKEDKSDKSQGEGRGQKKDQAQSAQRSEQRSERSEQRMDRGERRSDRHEQRQERSERREERSERRAERMERAQDRMERAGRHQGR